MWYFCYNWWTDADYIIIKSTPQFTVGLALGGQHSVGFDKCLMVCVCHCDIIKNCFTALKVICAPLSPPSPLPLNSWQLLIMLLSPQFCLFQDVIYLESCSVSLFRLIQSVCLSVSSCSLMSSQLISFWSLNNNIPLSGCTRVWPLT